MKNKNLQESAPIQRLWKGFFLLAALLWIIPTGPSWSLEPKNGYELAKFVYERDVGKDSRAQAIMKLIDRRGKERIREMYIATRDEGDCLKTLIVFVSPKDIAGTSFLSISQDNGREEQFLYLPALRRSRRIAGSFRFQRFVGSDFTYEDMERHHPDKYEHQLLGEENYLGTECWLLESRPKKAKDSQYSRFTQWITKDGFLPVKAEYYDKKGRLRKVYQAKHFKKIQGIWTVMVGEMKDLKKGHQTTIEVKEIAYNQGLRKDLFTVRSLEKSLKLLKRPK
ncbi:outer membrane lipoprotein-sorting protein [Thermosulfuriphilus sp.]